MIVVPGMSAIETQKVSVDFEFDSAPVAHRIGLIVFESDTTAETDFHRMLPDEGVMFHTARIEITSPITMESLRQTADRLPAAAAQIQPAERLDVIAYSCTAAVVALGYQSVAEKIRMAHPKAKVITPMTAAVEGLKRLDIEKISLLTPYKDEFNQPIRAYLEDNGISVLNIGSFLLEKQKEMLELPPDAIHEAAIETMHPEADALFISCTAIRASEVIESLEATFQKPVLTSIQCLFWGALRASGYGDAVLGWGELLRLE